MTHSVFLVYQILNTQYSWYTRYDTLSILGIPDMTHSVFLVNHMRSSTMSKLSEIFFIQLLPFMTPRSMGVLFCRCVRCLLLRSLAGAFHSGAPSSFAMKSANTLVVELLVITIGNWLSDLMRKTGRCVTLCS